LGKTAGKDVAATKATYPALFGLDKSRKIAAQLTQKARTALQPFGKKAEALHALADMLVGRDH
jgi:geranylgeranyl diphosphate synthase type II